MFGVIPFEIDADVSSVVPVRLDRVVVADELLEVQGVLLADVLDSKVVNNKGEGDGASFVEIQARSIMEGKYLPVATTFLSYWLASLPACLRLYMARLISM